jgi:hypothetical protein
VDVVVPLDCPASCLPNTALSLDRRLDDADDVEVGRLQGLTATMGSTKQGAELA